MKGTMKGGQVLHSFSQVVNSDMLPLGGHTTYNPEKNHSGDIWNSNFQTFLSLSLSSCLVSKSIIKNIEKDFVTKKKFLQMPPTTPMEAISFPLEIFSSTTYYLVKLTTPVVSQHLCLSEFHPVSLSVCLFVLISFICLLIALYRFVCLSVIKLPSLFCFVIISITMFNASISVYLFYFSFVVRFCWSLCYVSVFVSLFTSVTIFSP